MTARQLKHGLFLGFLMLINPIFWGTAIAGAAMPVASYSLTQAAEGRELYAEHCASCHGMNLLGNESGPALSNTSLWLQERLVRRDSWSP